MSNAVSNARRIAASKARTDGRTDGLTNDHSTSDESSPYASRTGGQDEFIQKLFEEPRRAPVTRSGDRDPISPLLRELVYRRDNWTCYACGSKPYAALASRRSGALNLDHIVPWSAGGADRSFNLRTMCGPCNEARSNFVSKTDKPAMPIVRICAPCVMVADARYEPLTQLPDRFEVYCGSLSHVSWAVKGWRVL